MELDLAANVRVVVEDLATRVAHGIPVRDKGPRVDVVRAYAREGVVVNLGLEGGGGRLVVFGGGRHLGGGGCLAGGGRHLGGGGLLAVFGRGGRFGRRGCPFSLLVGRHLRLLDLTVVTGSFVLGCVASAWEETVALGWLPLHGSGKKLLEHNVSQAVEGWVFIVLHPEITNAWPEQLHLFDDCSALVVDERENVWQVGVG